MRSPRKLAFAIPAMAVLVLVGWGMAQDKAEPKPEPVVIDLNKLPPEIAKRLIEEVAKQKAAAPATSEKKSRTKGGEKPSGGKKSSVKPAEKSKDSPAKPAEKKEKEPEVK